MSVWMSHKLPVMQWGSVQYRLLMARSEMKSSLHVAMLVRSNGIGNLDDVCLLLPDENDVRLFPGFTPISQDLLPEGLKILVGHEMEFARLFPDVARKIARYDEDNVSKHKIADNGTLQTLGE